MKMKHRAGMWAGWGLPYPLSPRIYRFTNTKALQTLYFWVFTEASLTLAQLIKSLAIDLMTDQ